MFHKRSHLYRASLALLPLLLFGTSADAARQCSYSSYQWSTTQKKAVNRTRISKAYSTVTADERDPLTGCSVCEEDQVELSLPGVPPFFLCQVIADDVEKALLRLQQQGYPFHQVIGYRPGRTRGDVDASGNRTVFSNHSYGVAIDINPQYNGLYDNCIHFNSRCRLIRGGDWLPGDQQASLLPDGMVVRALNGLGLRWGGRIQGRQKDFMHFSPSGY